jgi:hypothetical protein
LGDDWWVVKDCRSVHLAARVPHEAGEPVIQFIDETADPSGGQIWIFHVLHGSQAEALALARRVNLKPVVYR